MQHEPIYYLRKYRWAILAGLVCLCVVIAGGVWLLQQRQAKERAGKLPVAVTVVPSDATVTLSNGTKLRSKGDSYVKAGVYTVSVKKKGFVSHAQELIVSKETVPYVYVGLEGNSKQAKEWQQRHIRDYQQLELLTVRKNRTYNAKFKTANPIVRVLPIKDPYYTVDYRSPDGAAIELMIWGTSPKNRQAALDAVRAKGFDPTDYTITYENFTNPLKENQ